MPQKENLLRTLNPVKRLCKVLDNAAVILFFLHLFFSIQYGLSAGTVRWRQMVLIDVGLIVKKETPVKMDGIIIIVNKPT